MSETTDITKFAIGADIGGSHICSAVVNLSTGEICTEPFVTPVDCHAAASAILEAWQANLEGTVALFGKSVPAVGLAIPGPFDYARGVSLISGVGKYDSIYGLDLKSTLLPRLRGCGVSQFRFVNDASAFALGECLGGAARVSDRVVALTLGTGVGSGFVAGRHLVEQGPEVPANGWVYHLPFENSIADDAFSTRWICRRFRQLAGIDVAGAKDVADRAAAGDRQALGLFEEYGQRLGSFALPLLRNFSSHTLLLGGNISRAYNLFGPALEQTLNSNGNNAEVKVSTLLDRAALVGAASLFI